MSDFQPMTTFYLLKDIKIDYSYTNTMDFADKKAQYDYFYSKKAFEVLEGTYQRKTIGVINVPFLYDDIANCNYIMWQNANYSDKWYYAFILEIKYINPNVSQIVYDLDVIQTYMFDITWQSSQIDRDIGSIKSKDEKKPTIINREVEDLDYGSDYDLIYEKIIEQVENVSYIVVATTRTRDDASDGQAVQNVPLNLKYYFFPISTPSENDYANYDFTLNGKEITGAWKSLKAFQSDTKLVNSVVSVKMYPFFPTTISRDVPSGGKLNLKCDKATVESIATDSYGNIFGIVIQGSTNLPSDTYVINEKYGDILQYDEDKLYMFPYTFGVLTTKRGQDCIVKLEDVTTDNINILLQGTLSSAPKFGYIISNYNIPKGSSLLTYDQTQGIIESIENDCPVVDDYTASYLQSNSNSIKVANSNAKLMQQSALNQANNTYNTGQTIIDNKSRQAQINLATDLAKGSINAITTGLTAAANPGIAAKGLGAAIGVSAFAESTISAGQTYYNTQESLRNTALIESNTLKNANISANTDYQVAIASTSAKVQDAMCVPPTAKQLGGDYIFDILHNCNKLYYQIKTVKPYYAQKLQKYWKRYGTKQNVLRLPYLKNRKYWNYIKCVQANIFGDIPQSDLMKIRDIYMSGITIWHDDDIGNYDRDNSEV